MRLLLLKIVISISESLKICSTCGGKWPRIGDGSIPFEHEDIDRDEFDTAHTIYFLKFNERREVVGCARLNPTIHDHMLDTVFAEYCMEPAPKSPDIYEFSRLFVWKERTILKNVVGFSFELMAAVAEFSYANSIKKVSWYTSEQNYMAALGCWRGTRPLGMPQRHPKDDMLYIPAVSRMDIDAVGRMKLRAKITGPVSIYQRRPGEYHNAHSYALVGGGENDQSAA